MEIYFTILQNRARCTPQLMQPPSCAKLVTRWEETKERRENLVQNGVQGLATLLQGTGEGVRHWGGVKGT